jgi:hypothetical protein
MEIILPKNPDFFIQTRKIDAQKCVDAAIKYSKSGFISFTFGLYYDNITQKKVIRNPIGYNDYAAEIVDGETIFTNVGRGWMKHRYYDEYDAYKLDNGVAIRCGVEFAEGKSLILIDLDNKEKIEPKTQQMSYNGFDLWKLWEEQDKSINDTPYESTSSGGRHYYYYVDAEQAKFLIGSKVCMEYNNKWYSIDYKFTGQPAIVCPSFFYKNGKRMEYKWIGEDITEKEIKKLPDVIFNTIKRKYDTTIKKLIKNINGLFDPICDNPYNPNDENNAFTKKCELSEISEYLKYINTYNVAGVWRHIGYILKNLNLDAFDLYHEWSKLDVDGYRGKNDCLTAWKSHYPRNYINKYALNYYVKLSKMDGYQEFLDKKNIECSEMNTNPMEIKKINQNFISAPDGIIHTEDDPNTSFDGIITNWINSDDKILSVHSPCGTGKTSIIKNLINSFPDKTKRILYLSYRRSISREKKVELEKCGFESYLDKIYTADRQIMQIDSISKLSHCGYGSDYESNAIYDLIIIDEIESILAHITSEPIRKKGYCNDYYIFSLLSEIISNSSKLLVMDGFITNRTYSFISSFNCGITNVVNEFKHPSKNLIGYEDREIFDKCIYNDLDAGKKIVICCMSATAVGEYSNIFKTKYPKLKVAAYTSKTDDAKKIHDMEHVGDVWASCDILLYSPVIESGVDFNFDHFDGLYIIYCKMSICCRGVEQMTKRVRKFKSPEMKILFENVTKAQFSTPNFEEILLNYRTITRKDALSSFDYLVCYNEYENVQSQLDFYHCFLKMNSKQGNDYNEILKVKKEGDKKKTKKEKSILREQILNAPDIEDDEKYEEMRKKVCDETSTTADKCAIEKYSYKKVFCSDVDDELFSKFYGKKYIMFNHLNLIDIRNVKNYDFTKDIENIKNFPKISQGEQIVDHVDYYLNKEIKKVELVKKLINELGFKNYKDNTRYAQIEFDDKLNESIKYIAVSKLMDNIKMSRKQLDILRNGTPESIKKGNADEMSRKMKLGKINSILHKYGCEIGIINKYKWIDKKCVNIYYYSIGEYKNIDDYVRKRIIAGYITHDEHGFFADLKQMSLNISFIEDIKSSLNDRIEIDSLKNIEINNEKQYEIKKEIDKIDSHDIGTIMEKMREYNKLWIHKYDENLKMSDYDVNEQTKINIYPIDTYDIESIPKVVPDIKTVSPMMTNLILVDKCEKQIKKLKKEDDEDEDIRKTHLQRIQTHKKRQLEIIKEIDTIDSHDIGAIMKKIREYGNLIH